MESQLHRQDEHQGYEEEPRHSAVEGEGESEGEGVQHHGEKKSVLTKMKDKAKKIKDAIKKHGHGQDHGHNLEEEDGEEEEEDDGDEQMTDDPQVHGSPMLDSTVIGSVNPGQRIIPGQTGVNIEKPTESHEDGFNRNVRDEGVTPGGLRDDMGRTTAMETDEGRATARETAQFDFGKVADSPVMGREEANVGQTKVEIGQLVHSPSGAIPPSNYQSKVVDPKGIGGEEVDVAPLVGQFDKMNVNDQTDRKSKPESESSKIRTSSCPENPDPTLNRLDPGKTEDMPCDTVTGKLSYATSAIADKAICAKNAVASKLGYGGHEEGGDRATLVGNEGKGTDKGISVKDYLAEKFRPGDEDKALSEAISGALHKKKGEAGKPVGEATESEQMSRHLGTGSENKREGEDALSAGNENKGTGMVDTIKDAVGSWLGKSAGMQTAQDSPAQSSVSDTVSTPT